MARPVLLFTNPWADVPLEDLAQRVADWGYAGVELSCRGDHFEVQRALDEADYAASRLDLLSRHDLQLLVLSNHAVGHAVCTPADARLQPLLPEYVWGDGDPEGVSQRAIEEMIATIRAAQKIGAPVVAGFVGSPIWSSVAGWPALSTREVADAFRLFARRWDAILDVCRETGIRFAFEVHPGQIAYDLYSAEVALDAIGGREEFGFLFDPSHLHWQGVDPLEFVHRFSDRIVHVHVKDAALALNGRSGILNSYLPPGDPRRGWDFRSPGRGGIDWEAIMRALNYVGYDGPLSVDWSDGGMNRDYGAADACQFVKRLDFDPNAPADRGAFR
jgi:sugar phosphate isomerase/epimerase